jgi:hypothetical protein
MRSLKKKRELVSTQGKNMTNMGLRIGLDPLPDHALKKIIKGCKTNDPALKEHSFIIVSKEDTGAYSF